MHCWDSEKEILRDQNKGQVEILPVKEGLLKLTKHILRHSQIDYLKINTQLLKCIVNWIIWQQIKCKHN